jgi:excinuclease ABC subunit C
VIEVANIFDKKNLIPEEPGVYKYLNLQGEVIYVGKAKNLKKRILSYFSLSKKQNNRTYAMINKANIVEWTIVSSEIEALTLEYSYIQKFKPKYNILYTDDKSYPYLAIDYNDKFPRVFITRSKRKVNIKYFGPFPQIWAIRQTLSNITDIFPLRTCAKGVFQGAKMSNRPCLLGFIGKCLAPCVDKISQSQYKQILEEFSQFMFGNTHGIKQKLRKQMLKASDDQNYELAALYKKKLDALNCVLAKNSAEISDSVTADFFAIISDELEAAVYAFYVAKGSIIGEQKWLVTKNLINSDVKIIENILFNLYSKDKQIPGKIFLNINQNIDFFNILEKYLSGLADKKVKIYEPQKGKTAALLDKTYQNAKQYLETNKLVRMQNIETKTKALEEISLVLNMLKPPFRIECYDVSHTAGNYRTGSMVVFVDGEPIKKFYRQFNIRNNFPGAKDDTHAIAEVIARRLSNIDNSKDESLNLKPDLIIVDGGIPQVKAAARILEESRIKDIALCSLAKRLEEIYVPYQKLPIILSRSSAGLYLLQRLRDESHRFAINKHRARRTKGLLNS